MNIEICCSGCGKELEIETCEVTVLGALKLSVQPCHNKGCYVCGDCEEIEAKENVEKRLKEIRKIVN